MADIDALGFESIEIPHEFEIDLNSLVVVNHKLTLEGVDRDENEELEKLEKLGWSDPEALRSIEGELQTFYEDLRKAANNLAAVALVTRIQHWVSVLSEKAYAKTKSKRGKRKRKEKTLVWELTYLNRSLGGGPAPVAFFAELVDVRDSVIHGDSKAKWDRGRRHVAPHYANFYGDTEISDGQLKEAIEKATEQVKWYDDKLRAQTPPK
jgi:hypothetical protein